MAIQAYPIPKNNNFVGKSCVWCMDKLEPDEKVTCKPCLKFAKESGRSIGSWRASATLPPKATKILDALRDNDVFRIKRTYHINLNNHILLPSPASVEQFQRVRDRRAGK
jgi:hypothetical protein